jgi:hypothetical protein
MLAGLHMGVGDILLGLRIKVVTIKIKHSNIIPTSMVKLNPNELLVVIMVNQELLNSTKIMGMKLGRIPISTSKMDKQMR